MLTATARIIEAFLYYACADGLVKARSDRPASGHPEDPDALLAGLRLRT
jgi:hypothetical protein